MHVRTVSVVRVRDTVFLAGSLLLVITGSVETLLIGHLSR